MARTDAWLHTARVFVKKRATRLRWTIQRPGLRLETVRHAGQFLNRPVIEGLLGEPPAPRGLGSQKRNVSARHETAISRHLITLNTALWQLNASMPSESFRAPPRRLGLRMYQIRTKFQLVWR